MFCVFQLYILGIHFLELKFSMGGYLTHFIAHVFYVILFKSIILNNIFLSLDTDCPRLPIDEAITIPLTTPSSELSQMVLDLRMSNSFSWKSAIFMHDHSIGNKNKKQF